MGSIENTLTKMFSKLLLLCVGLVWCDDDAVMTTDMTPDEGPETGSAYVPGTAGGDWSDEEVASTRRRILKMITPIWKEKMIIGTATSKLGKNMDDSPGEVTENVIMRLVFHDCIPYLDGTGGCDGCLNWHGMYSESLGIQVPDSVEECLSGDMDACKDAIDAVEAALGIEIPEEFLDMASACMAEVMQEVGTRSLMRNTCPTMEEVKDWVEEVTGFQVPDIVEECMTGGNGCPYESVEDAITAIEASLNIQVPESVLECLSGDMDACEGAIDAVEAALGIEIPEEFIEMAGACMADVGL